MMNLKTTFYLIICILILCFSCETERITFDAEDGPIFINFENETASATVNSNSKTTVSIPVQISTVADTQREFRVEILEELTNTGADNYTIGNIVIPPDSFIGNLEVMLTDSTLTEVSTQIALRIMPDSNYSTAEKTLILTVGLFCEINDDFLTGTYIISDVTAFGGPANNTQNFKTQEVIIEPIGPGLRFFTTEFFPAFNAGSREVQLQLNESTITLSQNIDIGFSCNMMTSYVFGNAEDENASYSSCDDSVIIVNYAEDIFQSCSPVMLSSFKLEKKMGN